MDNQPVQQPDETANPTEPAPVEQSIQPQIQPQQQNPTPIQPATQTAAQPPTTSTAPSTQPVNKEPVNANPGQKASWKFDGNNTATNTEIPTPETPESNPITTEVAWSASEYVHHEKDTKWYFAYSGVSLFILGLVFLLTGDVISVGILAVLAIGFGVFAARKPETLNYRIDASGVHIGSKLYPITMFKSFAIVEEGSINSIALMPLKRFMPPITMYCAPEDEKKVEEALGAMLPQETKEQDRVDKLMHKVGF